MLIGQSPQPVNNVIIIHGEKDFAGVTKFKNFEIRRLS